MCIRDRLLPFLYLFVVVKHPWLKERLPKAQGKRKEAKRFMRSSKGFYLISILTVAVFFTSYVSFSRIIYTRAVIIYAQSTIARIAPHIDDQREEVLWAQLRSVRSAEDYYSFYDELQGELAQFDLEDFGEKPL